MYFPVIVLAQWLGSNLILYFLRYTLLGLPLLPTMFELQQFFIPSIFSRMIDLGLLIALILWLNQQKTFSNQKVELAERKAELNSARLQSLKNQLNPHFLFNAMHSITSQIGHDDEKARDMTVELSNLLRQLLILNEQDWHSVKEEVAFVKHYLDIETERFKDRLEISFDVGEECHDFRIPTMIMQPLVENALKHGVSKIVSETTVKITVKVIPDNISIMVENEVAASEKSDEYSGTGIDNLKRRLDMYYGESAKLILSEGIGTFKAEIILPR